MPEQSPSLDPQVEAWLAGIADVQRRADCAELLAMLQAATGAPPRMWGSMVGCGELHYRYDSGREGDTFVLGMASRKGEIVLYLGAALEALKDRLDGLPRTKAGKGCLYVKRLEDVERRALQTLLTQAAAHNLTTAP